MWDKLVFVKVMLLDMLFIHDKLEDSRGFCLLAD